MSAPVAPPSQGTAASEPAPSTSYAQILKSSVLIGSATLSNVGAGVIRSKATAVLLGPAGFGLMGLFYAILGLAQCITTMGISSSGVREIAAAVGSGERDRIARTAATLRWASLGLGVLGATLLALVARPVAKLTFGDADHTVGVALLGLAVVLQVVAYGNSALLQGMRRIADIARVGAFTGLIGTAATIGLVYFFREDGIVPAIISFAAASFGLSWWYSRQVPVARVSLTMASFHREARGLFGLGFAFMTSSLLALGASYVVRLVVAREVGLDAAGYYHAAWAIGSMYVGFVLESMASDFYPRLTGAISRPDEANRLVNEQAQISLLLAAPGVLGTITCAPLVISLLYAPAFSDAVGVLRWLCLGAALRVITWPMAIVIVARARQGIFLAVEVAYAAVYLAATWLLVGEFGLAGSGAAFLVSYVFHGLLVYPIVQRMTGFSWSPENRRLIGAFVCTCAGVFSGFLFLPDWLAAVIGVLATGLSVLFSVRTLVALMPLDRLPRPIQAIARWMHFA